MYVIQARIPKGNQTQVILYQDVPYCMITVDLQGNYIETDETELTHLALEEFYQVTYKNRAERESITELKNALEKSNKALNESELSVIELTNQYYELVEKIDLLYKHFNLEIAEETDEEQELGEKEHD